MKTTFFALLTLAATSLAAPAALPNTECFVKRDDGLLERSADCCYGAGCDKKREAYASAECFVKRSDGLIERSTDCCYGAGCGR